MNSYSFLTISFTHTYICLKLKPAPGINNLTVSYLIYTCFRFATGHILVLNYKLLVNELIINIVQPDLFGANEAIEFQSLYEHVILYSIVVYGLVQSLFVIILQQLFKPIFGVQGPTSKYLSIQYDICEPKKVYSLHHLAKHLPNIRVLVQRSIASQ